LFERVRAWGAGAAALALAAAAGCTIVVPPGEGDGGPPKPYPVPTPTLDAAPIKPLEAHLLFVMNLQQSSANLAPDYGSLAELLVEGLGQRTIEVTRWAVVPTYPGADGLRLLLGQSQGTLPSNPRIPLPGVDVDAGGGPIPIPLPGDTSPVPALPTGIPIPQQANESDIVSALQTLAASGRYDGIGTTNEAEGTVRTGQHLVDAQLPPELGGLDGSAFFDQPSSLFIVAYLQPLARRCALGDAECQVDGRSPADIFTETGADGTATWLRFATGGMPIKQVVHVAIATKEGEAPAAFRDRCGAVNGFPKAFFDVMEPSGNAYFDPLLAALNQANPGTGQSADLCDLLGEVERGGESHPAMNRLVNSIAAMAARPTN
jgi:hypothetical protein